MKRQRRERFRCLPSIRVHPHAAVPGGRSIQSDVGVEFIGVRWS
jgi:hypothetical protein